MLENPLNRIPRVSTVPINPTQLAIEKIRLSRSATPTSPKPSPPISPKNEVGKFALLPAEVILEIFSFLPLISQKRINLTCHTFKDLCKDPTVKLQVVAANLKVLREKIPICIGFSSQSLKGVLEDRRRINPQIINLHGDEYLKALQLCELVHKVKVDNRGYLCDLARTERIRNLKTYNLAYDPYVMKNVKVFPNPERTEFVIISHWESAKFKTIEVENAEEHSPHSPVRTREHSPRSPRSRTTWKLTRIEYRGESLTSTQRDVLNETIAILNRRPIETLIRSQGELVFLEGHEQQTF